MPFYILHIKPVYSIFRKNLKVVAMKPLIFRSVFKNLFDSSAELTLLLF